ncbi:ABC transporter permease [Larkinella sp. VNQ87]|uniref:ABC transporter permease n=1 Tax=Larkinella sp. VNQ87 TaxID=3400921 RepID=UPI003BFD58A6
MLHNYLKIAFRTLLRHRTYSLLNVIGLAVGLGCGILIFLVVGFQLRFDTHHRKADRIYRIVTELTHENRTYSRGTPKALAEVLRREYPFIETAARIKRLRGNMLSVPKADGGFLRKFQEERTICFADPELFEVFDFQWKTGTPQTALTAPNAVVLTEKYARKYFGDANPVGQTLRLDNQLNLTVTGVLNDHPVTTNLSDEVYISYSTVAGLDESVARSFQDWENLNSEEMTYVTLPEGTPVGPLNAVFPAIIHKHYSGESTGIYHFQAQPLRDVHFNVKYGGRMQKKLLYAMGFVGLFLVLAACINFVNMATAQALRRSKEVGVRKAMGSTRSQLFGQFMTETALITLTAVVVALGMAQAGLPAVNQAMAVFSSNLSLTDLWQPKPLALFVGLVGCVIALAGFYPSLVLSGFNPITALRRNMTTAQVGGISVRRGLVVVQFFITQLFVIGVLVMMSQLRYIRNADLGFTKETVLTIPVPTPDPLKQATLRNRLLQIGAVQDVAFGNAPPASSQINETTFTFDNRAEPEKFETRTKIGDQRYVPLFDLKLLAGRNFLTSDTSAKEILVNETMVKRLGLKSPNAILGKRINVWEADRTVVGVVKDFHVNSLRMAVTPTVLFKDLTENRLAALKVSPARLPETVKQVEETWNGLFPELVFHYQFIDEILDRFYTAETIMLGFAQVFSVIAILIGCLGLYGLVSYMAESRMKEIGVRKVLGASVGQILWLFGREFGRLVLWGFAVAAPLGGWLMSLWLQDYTYRIQIEWWVFAATAGLATLITLVTVSVQSAKAALMNPVTSLRSE